jgi:LEA14-like dessication related protein
MRNKIMKKLMLFGIIAILLTSTMVLNSCSIINGLVKERVKEPKVDFLDAKISGLSLEAVDLLFDLKIYNPNNIGVKLAKFDYDLLLNGNPFVNGNQNKGIEIPSLGEENIQLPLTLKYSDIYRTFQNLREEGLSNYQMKFGLSFDVPVLGAIRIPVSKSGELPMIKIPKISFGALRLDKLNLTGADLKLSLKLNNPNIFSMILSKMQYDFKINGLNIVSGLTEKSMQISEKGESMIEIPVSVDFLTAGRSVYQIINGDKALNYQFGGNLDLTSSLPLLGKVNLPFSLSGSTNIIK